MATASVQPLHEFLDAVDLQRDALKTELNGTIFKVFSKNANLISKLLLREVKRRDNKAQKELQRLFALPVKRIVKKYRDPSTLIGEKLAREVISAAVPSKIEKGVFDWLKNFNWQKRKEAIYDENDNLLISRVSGEINSYTVNTTGLISNLLTNRMSPSAARGVIETNINTKDRETGMLLNGITGHGQSYLFKVADEAAQEAFAHAGIREKQRWVTFFTRSCPGCVERHGRVKTFERWQFDGMPRSGVTVCRSHCHCVLVPVEYPLDPADIAKPVPRERARIGE